MATYGRSNEIRCFLQSLQRQSYQNFELIVVDQNDDNRVVDIIKEFCDKIEIKYLRSEKGLSRARNVGIPFANGEIIAFPDDDCEYNYDVLERVVNDFAKYNHVGIITGKSISGCFSNVIMNASLKNINIYNVWRLSISYTIFLQKRVVDKVGGFDTLLGVGSGTKFGSGEETDYLIRALKMGFIGYNDKSIHIKHPAVNFNDKNSCNKAYAYSVGRLYVLKKHKYNCFFVFINIYYPLVKLILNFYNQAKVKYYWSQFLGRFKNEI
jgi:glycosyltransferase involved in cell wall biosynthesis